MNAKSIVVWKIKKGDLVRLKEYPTGQEDTYVYTTGIVISGVKFDDMRQQSMWPSVDVYVFSTGSTRECGPASVEIISNS